MKSSAFNHSFLFLFIVFSFHLNGQGYFDDYTFNRQDTLRGALNPLRSCYDVHYYDLDLSIDMENRSLRGFVGIHYSVVEPFERMQVDLFENMSVDSIHMEKEGKAVILDFEREGKAIFVELPKQTKSDLGSIKVYYSGQPTVAVNAPWDGGFSWAKDEKGRDWMGVSCEGIGASLWWPNKDHLSEEADSTRIAVRVDNPFTVISNGNLRSTKEHEDGSKTFEWFVSYPINNYNVSLNIGHYGHFEDVYTALDGDTLQCDYYVMDYNVARAKNHFKQVDLVLESFEFYFDKYPFWEDGYALIETPYLGMEHQSGIAYGNKYMRGYLGRLIPADMNWDYIIVHETGHEYFGNSVSTRDHAEMWIHESFTTYMEALYVEYRYGYGDVERYLNTQRRLIKNRQPIVGPMDVNFDAWRSSDHYYKGAWFLHTLRHHIGDDKVWFGLIKDFYKKYTIKHTSTEEFIRFVNAYTGRDMRAIISHYLYTPKLPVLVFRIEQKGAHKKLYYRWKGVEDDFDLSVEFEYGEERIRVEPGLKEKMLKIKSPKGEFLSLDIGKALIRTIKE